MVLRTCIHIVSKDQTPFMSDGRLKSGFQDKLIQDSIGVFDVGLTDIPQTPSTGGGDAQRLGPGSESVNPSIKKIGLRNAALLGRRGQVKENTIHGDKTRHGAHVSKTA